MHRYQLDRKNMKQGIYKKFTEYTIFLLLEEERTHRLQEVDGQRQTKYVTGEDVADEVAENVERPCRYQNLDTSAAWFVSRLNSPVNYSEASAQEWNQLDETTLTYLGYLTTKLRLEYLESMQPKNQFEMFVREAQIKSETHPVKPYSNMAASTKHLKSSIKTKPELGAWFDNWFQSESQRSALGSQSHQDRQDCLGNCFESLFESPHIEQLQKKMLSAGDASNRQSKYQEVDMSDKEIVELWLAHKS